MVDWFIGTMGFAYKDWKQVFYPAEMDVSNYLAYYSRIFNCVEIDSTFYGTPRLEAVQHWLAITPPDFKFCLKVPRTITHDLRLVGAEGLLDEFLERVRRLEHKLGAILFQFPPSFHRDRLPLLESLAANLPHDLQFAVEIRDPSWYTPGEASAEPALASMLRSYKVAWAMTEFPGLPVTIYQTAGYWYLRWIGQHGSYEHHDQERVDCTPNLRRWKEIIQERLDQVGTIYGFFNNDYAGFAAGTANRFKALMGLPVKAFTPPRQGTLF